LLLHTHSLVEAAGLDGLKESLERFNQIICKYIDQSPTHSEEDSQAKAEAIQRLHKLEANLDFDKLVALEDLFNTDALQASTYLGFEQEGLCKLWVGERLTELGFPEE
jgi:hypothetical protein